MARHKGGITRAEYEALAAFRYRIRRFLHGSEEAARAAGIEPQQHQLLLAIQGLPAACQPTIGELAERLQIQHHSAVELVDRSVDRGLVRRRRAAGDRRQVRVELLPKGEKLLRELTVHHRDALSAAASALVESLETLVAPGPGKAAARPLRRANARK